MSAPSDVAALARYPEIAVVLGGGLRRSDRGPTEATLLRADAAAVLARSRDCALIVSGGHGDGPKPPRSEAALMADRLLELGVSPTRIFIEDDSRDTASNAAFTAERYLPDLTPRPLIIVTSPVHMARSLALFALILGPHWPLEAYPAAPAANDAEQAKTEAAYFAHTREQLAGIEPGNIPRITARLRATMHEHVSDEL